LVGGVTNEKLFVVSLKNMSPLKEFNHGGVGGLGIFANLEGLTPPTFE